jgi:hypothetical protein
MSTALTKEQRDVVEEFLATYNELDSELRRRLGRDLDVPFTRLVDDFHARSMRYISSRLAGCATCSCMILSVLTNI